MQCTIPWSSNKALEWRTFPNLSWKDCFWRAVFTVYLHCLFKLFISPVTTTCLLCMTDLFQRKILSQLVHCCVVAASLLGPCPDPHSPVSVSTGVQKCFQTLWATICTLQAGSEQPCRVPCHPPPSRALSTAGPGSLRCDGVRGHERIAVSGLSNTQQGAALSWAPSSLSHPVQSRWVFVSTLPAILGVGIYPRGHWSPGWSAVIVMVAAPTPQKHATSQSSDTDEQQSGEIAHGARSGYWVDAYRGRLALSCCASPAALADAVTTALFTSAIGRKQ